MFSVLVYFLDRHDAEDQAMQRLDKAQTRALPDLVRAVIAGFTFKPEQLVKGSPIDGAGSMLVAVIRRWAILGSNQ